MKKYSLLIVLSLLFFNSFAQTTKEVDQILLCKGPKPTVFLVGSFHFAYYNFDAHKIDKKDQIDILSPEKQKEVKALMNYIYKFKPTKIAVESGPNTGYLMTRFRAWKRGERKLGKDEMEQIGFRLIDKFNLDTIYGVNDQPLILDLYDGKDSLCMRPPLDSIYEDWDFSSTDTLSKLYSAYYKAMDKLTLNMSLLDYFKYTNTNEVLNRGYGAYLIGDFKLGDTRGADALSMHWYNRNLRIYRKIQQISTSPNDRILVLFGRGHIEILNQLFQCSPEFNYIPFNNLK